MKKIITMQYQLLNSHVIWQRNWINNKMKWGGNRSFSNHRILLHNSKEFTIVSRACDANNRNFDI